MIDFRTKIDLEPSNDKIQYTSPLMFIGSCFAENIGRNFKKSAFHTLVNPFGILFNPISIAYGLKRLMDNEPFKIDELHHYNGLWHTFFHHSKYSYIDKEECIESINDTLYASHRFLRDSKFLFITLGTSWVYRLKETGAVVANCHKYPSSFFERELIEMAEVISVYDELLERLRLFNPTLKVVFSVSPVRHWKDGAHGNQISKANLLLGINKLEKKFSNVSYFPSYEILIDELRDYRFYANDMLHPSDLAIEYIQTKVSDTYLDQRAKDYSSEVKKIMAALNHKPFNSQSKQYQEFLNSTKEKVYHLEMRYPNCNFTFLTNKLDNMLKVIA